ncbi:MAG: hypothetical protein M3Q50_14135 [Chloroflexota bacterium]|nr:hypothetical protein [Chloroflexota bacterium]
MFQRVRVIPVLILVVSTLVFGNAARVAAQDATPSAAATPETNVRYLLPFTPDGLNPGLTATDNLEGVCGFASSAALDRPDAWDCLGTDSGVLDPCFENPFLLPPDAPVEVACLASPFTTDVVLLTVTQPLVREKEAAATDASRIADSDQGMAPGSGTGAGAGSGMAQSTPDDPYSAWDLPWGLELANGDRCSLLHGTMIEMAGQTVHYGCEDGGMVLGETDRSQSVWTVSYLSQGTFASDTVEVVTAWT